jgi:N-acyl-D-aspartate/D-glutamate deacylase
VNGVAVVADGKFTNARPGRVLRRGRDGQPVPVPTTTAAATDAAAERLP